MNRSLTAAVALATAMGMAGLAHAQSSAGPATTPNTLSPSTPSTQMTPPMTSGAPSGMRNPAAMSNPSPTNGAQRPQASSQMNQGMQQDGSQSQIQEAQQQLKQQGLYNGTIDGIAGPETQTAVSQFQKAQGLPQTAQLDQQTMGRLMEGQGAGTSQSRGGANSGMTQPMSPRGPASTQNPAASNTNR